MKTLHAAIVRTAESVLFAAAFLALGSLSLNAAAAENNLTVTATVLKHASMQVVSQPSSVVVTAADLARGYVDVAASSQIVVRSNTQSGYMLMFANQGDFVRQTLVKGLANDVQLGAAGGGVAQPVSGRGMTKTALDLGYRFVLSESAQQGVYAWPMRLSVTPL